MLTRSFWSSPTRKSITVLKALVLLFLVLGDVLFPNWVLQLGISVQLISVVLYYIGITFFFNLAKAVLMKYYLKRHEFSSEHRDSFTIVLRRLSSLLAHIVFFFVCLHIFGVEISEFMTALSLFAVAIVIMFTEHLNKFFNGLLVMFSDNFSVDDAIRVGDVEGRIRDIGFLHVELHTQGGDVVYVPNSVILNKEVLNYSRKRTRSVSVSVAIRALTKSSVADFVSSIKQSLVEQFVEVDEKSFFYTLHKPEPNTVTVQFEFRINTASWKREREIQRFIVNESLSYKA